MVTKQKGMYIFLKIYRLAKQSSSKAPRLIKHTNTAEVSVSGSHEKRNTKQSHSNFSVTVFSLPRTGMATGPLTGAIQEWGRSCLSTGKSTGEEFDRHDPWEATFPESRCTCLSKVNPNDIPEKTGERTE